MKKILCLIGVGLASMLLLAACGSDSSSSSSSSTSAGSTGEETEATTGGASGVAEAAERVAELQKPPTALKIPGLAGAPPKDRTAYWISCKYPECEAGDAGIAQAMKTLGWKVTTLKPDVTPESEAAAWTQAVAAKPDAILAVSPLPAEIIQKQLEEAESNGTYVALAGAPNAVGEFGVDVSVGSAPTMEANGVALTDWAIADSGGEATIAYLYDPSLPLHVKAFEAGKAEAEKLCPDCTEESIKASLAEAGKDVPGQVVSYLQKNPDVNYVLTVGSSSLGIGMPQAVSAAGLEVKTGSALSTPPDFEAVSQGIETVALPNELNSVVWRMADGAARFSEGEEVPAELAEPVGERQLLDESNIDSIDVNAPWEIPDVEPTFLEAWHLK
jgi:ribose transport system substrate-binding protein